MMAFGGHPGFGPPPMHHGFAPPPSFGGVPFGMGYPANLGQGYSYAPYVQQMPPPMVQHQPQGMYSNRSNSLYSSYNSSLYSTPTPRRNSELYSSTGSLTMASAAVQRAVHQPVIKQASIVKTKPVGHPPKHPPIPRAPAPVQHLHSARSPSPQDSPATPVQESPAAPKSQIRSQTGRSPNKAPLTQVNNNISPQAMHQQPSNSSPPRMGSPLLPQHYGIQKRIERYEYSQYGNQNQNITYGASPSKYPFQTSNGREFVQEIGYLC
mmetsp:Transcript_56019/g.137378  ORF Transcript_56019/g.137378 Transcript_56019/m.137378 type:complete len:266 (-) Transcript_56019:1135-1932(-)